MTESRKIAAILVADVVGYSRLAGADEDRTLSRLRGLRSDLIDPAIAAHHGRVVKRTGDGILIEFRSVVDAVRCAIEVQNGLIERNAGLPPDRRIEFRIGIHLGDVVEESDGDLMGDGVNIAARLEGICQARRDLPVRGRLSPGQGAARSGGHRSRPDPTQEHRRADPGLFAGGRRAGACEGRDARRVGATLGGERAENALSAGAVGSRNRPLARRWRRRLAFRRRQPIRGHRIGVPGRSRRTSPSSCCRSPIFPATHRKTISPTALPRISPRTFLASAAPSSSRATLPLPSRARTPTRGRSARSLVSVTC